MLRLSEVLICVVFAFPCLSSETSSFDGKSFGYRQVEQLFDDRPDLRLIIAPGSAVFERISMAFNGESFGQRIYWNNCEPEEGIPSCFLVPMESSPAMVLVTADEKYTAYDRVAMLVFELQNVENSEKMKVLISRIAARRIEREHFVDEMVKLELEALENVSKFFRTHPIKGAHGHIYDWTAKGPPSFAKYKISFANSNHERSNFEYYGKVYDRWARRRDRK